MGDSSGIDLARTLRMENPGVVIIFLTNFIQYAPEGFEVQAFRYLLKRDMNEKLIPYFEAASKEVVQRKRILTISVHSEPIDIPVSHILYLEANLRVIIVHLIHDERTEYHFYGNLSDLSKSWRTSVSCAFNAHFGKHGVHRAAAIRKGEPDRRDRFAFKC